MNKAELIGALESKLGSKKAASDALEAVLDVIIREVAKGGKVGITGFGTFQKVARGARTGRNPRTGETVKIKKTTSMHWFVPAWSSARRTRTTGGGWRCG